MNQKHIETFIVSSTVNEDEYVIVSCPTGYKDNLDGAFCHDNAFINLDVIPREKGTYKLECEIVLTNGYSGDLIDDEEPNLYVKILNTVLLYKI